MITIQKKTLVWRFGAIAVFFGLPLLLLGAAASNVIDATDAADQTARKRATTSSIVAQLEKHRARAQTPLDTSSLYLTSASDSLARAEIQARVTKMVVQAGGRLAEVQLTTTPEQEAAGAVAIQLSLSIDNKGLFDLLYAIESGLPLLDVTDLNAQRDDQTDGERRGDGALRVDITVRGHWRKGTG